jgi:DNA-binding IclR family transcriptional regulator
MSPDENPRSDVPAQPIASVGNALTLLGMFGGRESVRISEASRELGVSPSTASRLMSMLQYHGFVRQDAETRAYVSGPRLIEIGLGAQRRLDERYRLHPHLELLAAGESETVHFSILVGSEVVFVDGVEGPRPVKAALRLGFRRPAPCVSGGKALLARLDDEGLARLFPDEELSVCTDLSLPTRTDLIAEMKRVRSAGYAITRGESEPDIAAVAIAIGDARRQASGAIAISMPISRFREEAVPHLHQALVRTATDAGYEVGYGPRPSD